MTAESLPHQLFIQSRDYYYYYYYYYYSRYQYLINLFVIQIVIKFGSGACCITMIASDLACLGLHSNGEILEIEVSNE